MGISSRHLRIRWMLSHIPDGYCEIAAAPAEPRNDKSDSLLHPEGRKGKPESAFLPCHSEERSDVGISSRHLRFRRGFPVFRRVLRDCHGSCGASQ